MQNSSGGGFIWGVIITLVVTSLIWGIGSKGKYEGQTSEDWFNDYDEAEAKYQELHDCVEPYATPGKYISADDLYNECF